MRVLLTGGSGMVGRNFLDHHEIDSFVVEAPTSNTLNLKDYGSVQSFIDKFKPDMVIHAAGKVGGIQANMREPVSFLIDNLDMGRNLFFAMKDANVPKLINLGSSCMYPRGFDTPLSEEMVLGGELEPTNEGYALAKVTIARLCEYIMRENPTLSYKTLIPCNLYGPYDTFSENTSHLVPAIIQKLHHANANGNLEVDIWGDGEARREFMYAGDLADMLMYTIRNFEALPNMMNVGLGFDHTVNEYYEVAAGVIGYKGAFTHDLTKPVGMKRKLVSIDKQRDFGWKAPTDLQTGISKTYRHYLNGIKS